MKFYCLDIRFFCGSTFLVKTSSISVSGPASLFVNATTSSMEGDYFICDFRVEANRTEEPFCVFNKNITPGCPTLGTARGWPIFIPSALNGASL